MLQPHSMSCVCRYKTKTIYSLYLSAVLIVDTGEHVYAYCDYSITCMIRAQLDVGGMFLEQFTKYSYYFRITSYIKRQRKILRDCQCLLCTKV